MKNLGVFEAKNRLSELVERDRQGERIGIAQRGKLAAADVDECMSDIEDLLAQAIQTDSGSMPPGSTLEAARHVGLSACDAVCLDFARQGWVPLPHSMSACAAPPARAACVRQSSADPAAAGSASSTFVLTAFGGISATTSSPLAASL
jgi:hypothetical protein